METTLDESRLAHKPSTSSGIFTRFGISPRIKVIGGRSKGISAALTSAFFLGLAPIFGKQAILLGVNPLVVVALRTLLAAVLLLLVMAIFYRSFLYIYPAGLLGCLLAGWINGFGSLFYYSALGRIDAGVGHLIYSMYPLFLILWLSLDRQPPNKLTLLRLILAIPAIFLLTQAESGQVDLIGFGAMLIAAALYALHIPINQRVLYDMPAPTVAMYTLFAMSAVVVPVLIFSGSGAFPGGTKFWGPLIGLTMVTFLSRIALFLGVKHLGAMQTALLGLSELLIAVAFAHLWLGERFSSLQWIGTLLLVFSLLLVIADRSPVKKPQSSGWLSWLRSPDIPRDLHL